MRQKFKAAATAAASVAVVILGAAPAAAQENIKVYTDDAGWGGFAQFTAEGEHFAVCDTRSDGKRVVAEWWASADAGSLHGTLQDANGSGNSCTYVNEAFEEGAPVTLEVCLQDGASGTPHLCNYKEGVS